MTMASRIHASLISWQHWWLWVLGTLVKYSITLALTDLQMQLYCNTIPFHCISVIVKGARFPFSLLKWSCTKRRCDLWRTCTVTQISLDCSLHFTQVSVSVYFCAFGALVTSVSVSVMPDRGPHGFWSPSSIVSEVCVRESGIFCASAFGCNCTEADSLVRGVQNLLPCFWTLCSCGIVKCTKIAW